jgi:uncharacterized protein YbjT (DUF2867 family)
VGASSIGWRDRGPHAEPLLAAVGFEPLYLGEPQLRRCSGRVKGAVVILVIGGRSKIGTALIGELLRRNQRVRVLVRAGEPSADPSSASETVSGDLADEGSLVRAMQGIEKVFLLSSPHPDAVRWHRNAIDAARRTDVQLLVRSSIIGADRESEAPGTPLRYERGQHGAS